MQSVDHKLSKIIMQIHHKMNMRIGWEAVTVIVHSCLSFPPIFWTSVKMLPPLLCWRQHFLHRLSPLMPPHTYSQGRAEEPASLHSSLQCLDEPSLPNVCSSHTQNVQGLFSLPAVMPISWLCPYSYTSLWGLTSSHLSFQPLAHIFI